MIEDRTNLYVRFYGFALQCVPPNVYLSMHIVIHPAEMKLVPPFVIAPPGTIRATQVIEQDNL